MLKSYCFDIAHRLPDFDRCIVTSHPVGMRSIAMSVAVCVCLSVCLPLAYLKNETSKLHEIFFARSPGPSFGPPLTTMNTLRTYVMYFHITALGVGGDVKQAIKISNAFARRRYITEIAFKSHTRSSGKSLLHRSHISDSDLQSA